MKTDLFDKETKELMRMGRANYNWFMTHCLDVKPEHLWDGMVRVNNSVRDNEKTSVPAGHGVSKTYNLGRLALAFLYCYYPSTVVTTAPTGTQVKNLLWREIREAHANARVPLGGKPTGTMLDLQYETGVKWFAIGISTRPDTVTAEATKFQGYHNDNLLVIFDEAVGVMPEIWRASKHVGAPFKRFVAVGNPTNSVGDFADTLDDPTYNVVRISVKDTPNYKAGKTIIPGVYGREYEREIRLTYGEDSDEYRVRVEGLKSQKGVEGSYYGNVMAWLKKKGRITKVNFNGALPVYTVWDPGYTTAVIFFQIIGMEVAIIRGYEDSGLGMEDWARVLKTFEKEEGYRYAEHFAPIDTETNNAYKVVAGKNLLQHARENGIDFTILSPEYRVNEGIERARKFLYSCWFKQTNCKGLIKALTNYCAKKNMKESTEERPVFYDYPDKYTPWTHYADCFRYLSMAIERAGSDSEKLTKWRKLKEQYA